jgi:hypothetical protein
MVVLRTEAGYNPVRLKRLCGKLTFIEFAYA